MELEQIRVVLVETSHPGNIGSVARAMKNMGLKHLVLVNPKTFPSEQAIAMASHADDILDAAVVVDSLEAAIHDCNLVFGTSARSRELEWPVITPREMGAQIQAQVEDVQCAMVFGRESKGLTNRELQYCHYHVQIPTNPDYMSLNLAQAVQLLAYEARLACVGEQVAKKYPRLASVEDVEHFYTHFEKVLQQVHFLSEKRTSPEKIMLRLRRLFQRAQLEPEEVPLLRGVCSAIEAMKEQENG